MCMYLLELYDLQNVNIQKGSSGLVMVKVAIYSKNMIMTVNSSVAFTGNCSIIMLSSPKL